MFNEDILDTFSFIDLNCISFTGMGIFYQKASTSDGRNNLGHTLDTLRNDIAILKNVH